MAKSKNPFFFLLLGVATTSFAAILIRLSSAPSLVIAFYRLFYAVLILLPGFFFLNHDGLRKKSFTSILLTLLAGFFLALHFFFWITSLQYTSINSSVILVTTHPVLVALFSALFFKEYISLPLLLGIITAMTGSIIIGIGGARLGEGVLRGDLLAFLGAVMMAGYILTGSKARQDISLFPYILLTYSTASLILFFLVFFLHSFQGYSLYEHLLFFLLALGPTVIGHTCFNWALKYVPSTLVSVSILGEPIGATILALFIFQEFPSALALLGGFLVFFGIYKTVISSKSRVS